MNKAFLAVLSFSLLMIPFLASAQVTQIIRGQVSDVASGEPMSGVTIQVEDLNGHGAISDAEGYFVITDVPVGRHSIRASYVGYEPLVMKEQLLSSGKELMLNLRMRESISELGEVVVKPRVNKQMPLNEMAQVGARMFSVEEATRYAGGMADPARTALMFAGVASGGSTNGISIHGNSPQMLQWRVEGVEVYNPNHFADITGLGGGIFTSLNGTVLANSDFLSGAMPAEFGNALSGAFDMKMRSGNNRKHEHAVQVGTLGVDFASEGPLGKNTKASYLVNYRYSFLEIAKKMHAINMEDETLDYQDLSFKLNFPSASAGTFSLWFTGLIDNYRHDVPDPTEWKIMWDTSGSWSHQRSCAGGLTHTYRFKTGGSLNTNIAYTGSYSRLAQDDYTEQMQKMPIIDGRYAQWNIIISLQHQHKFSSRYTMQNGFEHQHLDFHTWVDFVHEIGEPLYRVSDSEGNTGLTRFYTNHKLALNRRLTAVAGVNVMWFNLNNQWLAEPRLSLQYKTSASSTLSVAYALNSRKENTDTYFVYDPNDSSKIANKDLGLTRSHHISASFAQRLGENVLLKIEPYWQWLFDVPVESGTAYSILNQIMFSQDRALVNEGAGRNYGIDFTLERYLNNGLYGMMTATLFKSEYRDAQGMWHHSRHDRLYVANILGGKEWMVGRADKNVFGFNGRLTLMGGDRYTPIPADMTFDDVKKRPDQQVPVDDGPDPYNAQKGMNVGYAFSLKYTINKQHTAHHIILEYLQLRTFNGQTFDLRTHELVDQFTSMTFPNIAYRVEF